MPPNGGKLQAINIKSAPDMETRDKLSTKENFLSLIKMQAGFIEKWKKDIENLKDSENKGIQLYSLPNFEVIQNGNEEILHYEYDNLLATYSAGEDIDKILPLYKKIVSLMGIAWHKENGYVQMVNMLSIGILLDVKDVTSNELAMIIQRDNPNDFLVDYLLHHKCKTDITPNADSFLYGRPYQATREIVLLADKDKEASIKRLKKYLSQEWYRGHSDCGWYNIHKVNIYAHSGYWSFESGALVKILGLDDSSLKGLQYYPYDMVHWKDTK